MNQIIEIVRRYDDYDPVVLGYVKYHGSEALGDVLYWIQNEGWEAFQVTEPECDYDFIAYIINNHDNFSEVQLDHQSVVVG